MFGIVILSEKRKTTMKKVTKSLIALMALGLPLAMGACSPAVKYVETPRLQEAKYESFEFSNHTKTFINYTLDSYEHTFTVKNVGNEYAVFAKPEFGLKSSNENHKGSFLNTGIHSTDYSIFALAPNESCKVSFVMEGYSDLEEMYLVTQSLPNETVGSYQFSFGDVYNKTETLYEDDYHLGYTFSVAIDSNEKELNNRYNYFCCVKYSVEGGQPFEVMYEKSSYRNVSLDLYYKEGGISQYDVKVLDAKCFIDYHSTSQNREAKNLQSKDATIITFSIIGLACVAAVTVPAAFTLRSVIKNYKKQKQEN